MLQSGHAECRSSIQLSYGRRDPRHACYGLLLVVMCDSLMITVVKNI